jgi:predicted metal-dependent TIM-barrel fold hydrolase
MDNNEKEKNPKGLNRRGFLKAAGVLGGMAVMEKAMASSPGSVAGNPLAETIDMHVHSGPDVTLRSVNDFQLAQKAKEAGMRGVLMKNHEFPTDARAYLVKQAVPGVEVFGGITLNYAVGAINPDAVETMLRFSGGCGKEVKLCTYQAAHDMARKAKKPDAGGIQVLDGSGNVIPELRKIMKMVAKADVIFSTGHVSPREALIVIKAAKEEGVRKIMATHAMGEIVRMSLDDVKRAVEMGAFIEHCYLNVYKNEISIEEIAKAIKETGADHNVIATDLGQALNPVPSEGLREFIIQLYKQGIKEEEIDLMSRKNPARLLGIEAV